MKSAVRKQSSLLLALFAVVLTVGLVSWGQQQTPGHYGQTQNDTTPKKKNTGSDKKIRDLDDVLAELNETDFNIKADMEKALQEVAEAMKKFDSEKIKLEIEKAMKEVDMDKIQKEIAGAMKEVDMVKIQKEVQESLAKVDFEKIKAEISDAMKEVDMEKIQKEVKESLSKIDWDNIKEEMQRLKETDMKKLEEDLKKMQEEMKNLRPGIEKELEKAKTKLEKAKTELKEFKEFVDGLQADGLIDKERGYTLKHKNGELFINDKKASEQVYNKYRSFLNNHREFTIKKTDEDFDMDLD